MQEYSKPQNKGHDESLNLIGSLSARVSPLYAGQDFNTFFNKGKGLISQPRVSPKHLSPLPKKYSETGAIRTKLSKIKLKQQSEKTIIKEDFKPGESLDVFLYINELRKKLKQVLNENKKLKRVMKEDKKKSQKVWSLAENLKNKLFLRLLILE